MLASFIRRYCLPLLLFVALAITLVVPVQAADDIDALRTVSYDRSTEKVYTRAELNEGRRLFNRTCGQCHLAGQTYTNPDVSLSLAALTYATPPRDTVVSIIDYLNEPTSYDGFDSLLEYHPNTQLTSEFPKMKFIDNRDMELMAAHILNQARVIPGWGGSKSEAHDIRNTDLLP